MPRGKKCRKVSWEPPATVFKPSGIPARNLEEVVLKVEEFEALRLKNLNAMEQEQAAQEMQISRPTFQRILNAAYQKIAEALSYGKQIRIEGGNYCFGGRFCRRMQETRDISQNECIYKQESHIED